MQARSTITSPACIRCGGGCCRGDAVQLTPTDVRRIVAKTGQPEVEVITPGRPFKRLLGGRKVTIVGRLKDDDGMCHFLAKTGCTLGDAQPFHCRVFYCDYVIDWAANGRVRLDLVPAAVKVLQAVVHDKYGWDRVDRYLARVKQLRARLA